jgi:L-lactate dehydrogenase (cytochrome)/(S)-mandelate dehydrogenase
MTFPINLHDLSEMAQRRLPRIVFDFVEGGADDESGLARNRDAFARYALLPRSLVDVTARDQSVTVLGRRYDAPFGICPMGHCGLVCPGADLMLARAAAKANIPYLMSSASNASIEQAVDAAPANTWFQIYTSTDERINTDLVRRARSLSIEVLVVTIDVPVSSNRERNRRNGFSRPPKPSLGAALDALRHPGWLARFYRGGGIPPLGNWLAYAPDSPDAAADLFGRLTPDPAMTWERFQAIRSQWPGKLVLKGILNPVDAAHAARLGVDALLVSNHGGRQLDAAPAPLDVLPFIRLAAGDKVELLLDSGVRRGSDIVKALSLGARVAMFGRPWLYAIAAGGQAGIAHAIALMRREVDLVQGQIGLPKLDEAGLANLWAPGDPGLDALKEAASPRSVEHFPATGRARL